MPTGEEDAWKYWDGSKWVDRKLTVAELSAAEVMEAVAAGPGRMLGYVRVRPYSMKRRFLGFQILELLSPDLRFQYPIGHLSSFLSVSLNFCSFLACVYFKL